MRGTDPSSLPASTPANQAADTLTNVGLGLDRDALRFGRTTAAWLNAGAGLLEQVQQALDWPRYRVELIGSASVLDLLAKPIIDLAVGVAQTDSIEQVTVTLEGDGWIYRGDFGADGGHLFVLEARPSHRVAHLHVVDYDGTQWRDYLQLRDLLRRSQRARTCYEAAKVGLAADFPGDRTAYTHGKSDIVTELISAQGR